MVLKLLKEDKEVLVDTLSPIDLIYALRSAANTEFPELKNWRFSRDYKSVRCTPKNLITVQESVVDEYTDYLGIIAYVIEKKPDSVLFTSPSVSEREMIKLIEFCNSKQLSVTKTEEGIRIHHDS